MRKNKGGFFLEIVEFAGIINVVDFKVNTLIKIPGEEIIQKSTVLIPTSNTGNLKEIADTFDLIFTEVNGNNICN